ncbi:MAG: helix-turn-helix transcriptional regulator [Candidatus Limnocylindrales bacterium]|jgi:PadR family transcriptional regulator PadR
MSDRIRTQLLKGTTTLLVLTVLHDGELYGYEIAQRIRERSGGAFVPSEGSLYPALHALEADGALQASWRESNRGPRRRYYKITKTGLGMLEAHAQEWAAFSVGMARAVGGANQR